MREIKFRAWVVNPRKSYIGAQLGKSIMIENILKLEEDNLLQELPFDTADKVEFMQFTGLQDKNGVDIYEGDILSINTHLFDNELAEVIFLKGFFGLFWLKDKEALIDYLNDYSRHSVVVGNIYENKELLE